jgi:hypothetical protein
MRTALVFVGLGVGLGVFVVFAAENYTGPKPAKPDLPYLLHAGKLVATESSEAREEKKGKESTYIISGAASQAKTPLPEPIFIIDAQTLAPERMELYKVEARNGVREVSLSEKRRKGGGGRPIHLTVFPLGGKLYRLEAGENLDEGEYCLSPSESNRVFCFAIY